LFKVEVRGEIRPEEIPDMLVIQFENCYRAACFLKRLKPGYTK
jgi:hypothetical protein